MKLVFVIIAIFFIKLASFAPSHEKIELNIGGFGHQTVFYDPVRGVVYNDKLEIAFTPNSKKVAKWRVDSTPKE